MGLGAEGRAGRALLDARPRRLPALRPTARRRRLPARRCGLRPRPAREADGGDAAAHPPAPGRLAAPPAMERPPSLGEGAAPAPLGGGERAHGRGATRGGRHGLAREPAARHPDRRGARRLRILPGEDLLADAARGLLPPPAAAGRGGRRLRPPAGRRLGARSGRTAPAPLPARRLALVPRRAAARRRPRQGGRAGDGGSLLLPAADRRAPDDRVGGGRCGRLARRRLGGGCGRAGRLRRADRPAARYLAGQRLALCARERREPEPATSQE